MRLTLAASCAVAFCGHFGAPHDFTSQTEQFVMFLYHILVQLANRALSRLGYYCNLQISALNNRKQHVIFLRR